MLYVSIGSAAFALAAAVLWFCSALIKLPNEISVGFGGVGGSVQDLGDQLRNSRG